VERVNNFIPTMIWKNMTEMRRDESFVIKCNHY
jgi:hypothetical protein